MKSPGSFAVIILIASSLTGYAQNKTLSTQPVDVTHVSIDLRFDWSKKQATGSVTIEAIVLKPARTVLLDAVKLDLQNVTLNKNRPLKFNNTGDSIAVSLDRVYANGEKIKLRIDYNTKHVNEFDPLLPGGSFGKGLRFFQPTKGNPLRRKQIWSQSEPDGDKYWLPRLGDEHDLRTTEFKATADKPLTVISNGNLISLQENKNGTNTFHYKSDTAYPGYLTAFVVGEFNDLQQQYNGIPLHTFCYPDETEAAIATTDRLPDMMKFISEKTGMNYPFKRYSQVMVQNYPFPGLTGQHTFSIISDNMIDDYGTHADFLYLWDGVEFNALASQWFGNVIIPAQWSDVWLTKSFAHYFEGLYTAERNGQAEYLLWYHPFEIGSVLGDWQAGNRHPIVATQYGNIERFTSDSYAKYRGSLVLRMLRKELGDKLFFDVIKRFVKNHAFKPVTTSDFHNEVKAVTGNDFQWFFDQWIFGVGHPMFEVSKQYDDKTKSLKLTIDQVQQPDTALIYPAVKYFRGKMLIKIDQRMEVITLEPKQRNEFTFGATQPPGFVHFDPENTWIKEISFVKTLDESLIQFLNDDDLSGRQAAMNDIASIARDSTTSMADKTRIHDAFYNVIGNDGLYWRMRAAAIGQWRSILPLPYEKKTIDLLTAIIQKERSWLKAAAVGMLGATGDQQFADVYISMLRDTSDRVVNSASVALGKSKSPNAFDALLKLRERPSWKRQSLMACLNGLAALNDPRGAGIALAALKNNQSPRWFLANGWDYPLIAAQTLAALGKGAEGFPIVEERLNLAIAEQQTDDIFEQILLLSALGDERGIDVIAKLKVTFRENATALAALDNYEQQLKSTLKK